MYVYMFIYNMYIYIYIYTNIIFQAHTYPPPKGHDQRLKHATANPRTNIMDFRGFDSIISLISLRGGILMPIGNFPEDLSQAILAGIMLVGRLGVATRSRTPPRGPGADGADGSSLEFKRELECRIPRLDSPVNSRGFPEIFGDSVKTKRASCRHSWKTIFSSLLP